jgi:hypothetical protein
MGTDTRANILPVETPSGPGFFGPNYNPADELAPPDQIGVHRGEELSDLIGAAKGAMYYVDVIGFGKSSNFMTRGMGGLSPMGVNYFVQTGQTCSNGAKMWQYMKTIPEGNALGTTIQNGIRSTGLPSLQGLIPGMIEDSEAALNPMPLIHGMAGSGYPVCKLSGLQMVGTSEGKVTNVDGESLVDTAGLVQKDGLYYQEKWIQDTNGSTPKELSYEDWQKEPKLYNANGCLKVPSIGKPQPEFCRGREGFVDLSKPKNILPLVSLVAVTFGILAALNYWSVKRIIR